MDDTPEAETFEAGFPRLGIDGSLGFVTDFEEDPSLAGARGQVLAKTGTFITGTPERPDLRNQSFAGYIQTRSGRRVAYMLAVNEVGILTNVLDVIEVFQDEGTISAILWRDF